MNLMRQSKIFLEEDLFSESAQDVAMIMHEDLLLL